MVFDNFILYIFYQTMFEKKRESIPKYAVVVSFLLSDLIYWLVASHVTGKSSLCASILRSALTVILSAAISMFFCSTITYRILVVFSYIALINLSENLAYFIHSPLHRALCRSGHSAIHGIYCNITCIQSDHSAFHNDIGSIP